MAMNEMPRSQRITSGPSNRLTDAPMAAAPAWLASVATRMPMMIGSGLRNLEASSKARS
jgi:hypothetical protein